MGFEMLGDATFTCHYFLQQIFLIQLVTELANICHGQDGQLCTDVILVCLHLFGTEPHGIKHLLATTSHGAKPTQTTAATAVLIDYCNKHKKICKKTYLYI